MTKIAAAQALPITGLENYDRGAVGTPEDGTVVFSQETEWQRRVYIVKEKI